MTKFYNVILYDNADEVCTLYSNPLSLEEAMDLTKRILEYIGFGMDVRIRRIMR